jgi:hypothetical protein
MIKRMIYTNRKQFLGRFLYYIILLIIPIYILTIGTPHTRELINPESIVTLLEEGSDHYSYANAGLVVRAVNKYQVTENWATFETIDLRYYDKAVFYAILFDSIIILAWRLNFNNR